MIDWKPIGTIPLAPTRNGLDMRSQDVLLWVKSDFGYSGPVVGYFSVNVSVDGTVFESVSVSGVGGWECEEDFGASDVTHWAELPKGPGEE